jgi:hypothetical protein
MWIIALVCRPGIILRTFVPADWGEFDDRARPDRNYRVSGTA